mgnify:CR=1 FL=1|jgi:hypothetical protein
MKINLSKLCAVLTATALLAGCTLTIGQTNRKTTVRGSRNLITKTFPLGNFTRIDASGMYDIDFYQTDDNPRVEVNTSDNIMEFVEVGVKGPVLNLGLSDKHRYDIKKIRIKVYSAELDGLTVRGAADVSITHGLMTRALDVEVNGTGNIRMENIDASYKIKIEINGAGNLDASRISAGDLTVQIDGSGNVEVYEIESETVTVAIRGAGKATLSGTTGTSFLKINGVGSIDATQLKAENYEIEKSGIGSIKR